MRKQAQPYQNFNEVFDFALAYHHTYNNRDPVDTMERTESQEDYNVQLRLIVFRPPSIATFAIANQQ